MSICLCLNTGLQIQLTLPEAMYHPQFDLEGGQCFELRYSPASRLTALFTDFAGVLESPSTANPLNVEAAELYDHNRTQVLSSHKSYIRPRTLLWHHLRERDSAPAPLAVRQSHSHCVIVSCDFWRIVVEAY